MTRIEKDKQVLREMIEVYCRKKHPAWKGELCAECSRLLEYAFKRMERCPKGEAKTSCRKCEIHCYSPEYKVRIKAVMRYVGPRMLFINPGAAIRHLIAELG